MPRTSAARGPAWCCGLSSRRPSGGRFRVWCPRAISSPRCTFPASRYHSRWPEHRWWISAWGWSPCSAVLLIQGVPIRVTMLGAVSAGARSGRLDLCRRACSPRCSRPSLRDFIHAVHLGLRVGFFATPVMYDGSFLPDSLAWTRKVNPVAVAIEQTRAALLCGTWPDFNCWPFTPRPARSLWSGAVLYTRSVESRIADVI